MRFLLAAFLIVESIFNALYVAGLLRVLSIYDVVAIVLIFARGMTGALQFTGGWTLVTGRPAGAALARLALIVAAVLTTLDVGFNLAPTSVYPWWRWQVAIGYWVYAVAGILLIRRCARFGVPVRKHHPEPRN